MTVTIPPYLVWIVAVWLVVGLASAAYALYRARQDWR